MVCGFVPRVRGRRGEKAGIPGRKARRWVVEAAHSWMNGFRKLPVRFEKPDSSCLGLLMLACAFIAFRKADLI